MQKTISTADKIDTPTKLLFGTAATLAVGSFISLACQNNNMAAITLVTSMGLSFAGALRTAYQEINPASNATTTELESGTINHKQTNKGIGGR